MSIPVWAQSIANHIAWRMPIDKAEAWLAEFAIAAEGADFENVRDVLTLEAIGILQKTIDLAEFKAATHHVDAIMGMYQRKDIGSDDWNSGMAKKRSAAVSVLRTAMTEDEFASALTKRLDGVQLFEVEDFAGTYLTVLHGEV